MSKYRPINNKSVPIGTVAPISKKSGASSTGKSGAGSAGKSGAGFVAKSAKSGNSFGSGSKNSSVFGSSGKSKSSTFGSGSKSNNTFGLSGKSSNANSKSPSFIPFGSSGKSSSPLGSGTKPTVPLLLGGKTTSAFASSPNKSYPSTSFSNPKRSSTSFGFIWIPGRKSNKKKEYVHVSHRDDGYKERSPSMYPHEYNYMSGDSPNHQPFKKKEEESSLPILERPKGPIATVASSGTALLVSPEEKVLTVQGNTDPANTEEKQEKQEKPEFIKYDKEETKEAAGDAAFKEDKDDKNYLECFSDTNKTPIDGKVTNDRGDKVDSVYLRPPPPHKVRSNTSNVDEEGCGIKCLYYTLQCCDCVLM